MSTTEAAKRWNKNNADKMKAYKRKYVATHKEQLREYYREYYRRNHPEKEKNVLYFILENGKYFFSFSEVKKYLGWSESYIRNRIEEGRPIENLTVINIRNEKLTEEEFKQKRHDYYLAHKEKILKKTMERDKTRQKRIHDEAFKRKRQEREWRQRLENRGLDPDDFVYVYGAKKPMPRDPKKLLDVSCRKKYSAINVNSGEYVEGSSVELCKRLDIDRNYFYKLVSSGKEIKGWYLDEQLSDPVEHTYSYQFYYVITDETGNRIKIEKKSEVRKILHCKRYEVDDLINSGKTHNGFTVEKIEKIKNTVA